MKLGLRLFFGFFLITGLAAFFVMRVFVAEVQPSVREVMEDLMVDTANILAELAADAGRDLSARDGRQRGDLFAHGHRQPRHRHIAPRAERGEIHGRGMHEKTDGGARACVPVAHIL